jgi:tRNA-Thr(GGU) m(6)t(6)A37 methyltransferase TsaA
VHDGIWDGAEQGEAGPVQLVPIGVVRAPRGEVADDFWGGVVSEIKLSPAWFDEDAVAELDSFSHIEVIFHFHKVAAGTEERGARHPRGNEDWPKVGILAQRAKRRPNRLGLTRCRLVKVEGLVLTVEGLDAIDGTPVIDVKPYMREFDPIGETHQPAWSSALMENYFATDADAR